MAAAQENTTGSICPGGFINDRHKYMMNNRHRGRALIFVHTEFETSLDLRTRNESEVDVNRLKDCFGTLRFDVEECPDLTVNAIKNKLNEVSQEDHKDCDCLVVIVLTHGAQGLLYAKDDFYPQEHLWSPFTAENCRSLIDKPKLFFIQACRGGLYDPGMKLPVEKSKVYIQPNYPNYNMYFENGSSLFEVENDFLVAFATVSGYVSWRKPGIGSVFIEKLCSELTREENSKEHLLSILTSVQQRVAIDYSSRTLPDEEAHDKKQIPSVTHRLMKLLYFNDVE